MESNVCLLFNRGRKHAKILSLCAHRTALQHNLSLKHTAKGPKINGFYYKVEVGMASGISFGTSGCDQCATLVIFNQSEVMTPAANPSMLTSHHLGAPRWTRSLNAIGSAAF